MEGNNYPVNNYIAEKQVSEYVNGGPAYFRPSYMAPDPFAPYRSDLLDAPARPRGRVVCLKLPWMFAIIKLPYWSHIGQPLQAD